MINFVSNLPKDLWTGGFSAMNAAASSVISNFQPTHYVGPLNPPGVFWEKAVSKGRRLAGLQGSFFFFSQRRLAYIAEQFDSHCRSDACLDFFHGFTPWILTKPKRPYIAWSDCTFQDYVSIYCRQEQFETHDLQRIAETEAAWLQNADRILFTSEWGARRAITHYGLKPTQVATVGIFGNIDSPTRDLYDGSRDFVFVSTNFEAKGGWVVLSAFRKVRTRYPGTTLTIIGDHPSGIRTEPGLTCTGVLRKECEHERQRFQRILGRARALVYPTKCDIAPLLIVEAGYFGCPVITTRRFAIPELVDHARTGLLLDDPSQVNALVQAMCWMLEADEEYLRMRHTVRETALEWHSKAEFDRRLRTSIAGILGTERTLSVQ